jgi:hypothetical protein
MSDKGFPIEQVVAMREIRRAARGKGGAAQQRKLQGSVPMGAVIGVFPLILVPVLIYNIIAFGGGAMWGALKVRERFDAEALTIPMASNVNWIIHWGDLLLLVALIMLFVELLKSTSTGTSAIFNHALSMLVFIVCLIEFLLSPAFATSTFFLIMIMSLLDVLAGVIVTIVSARRDVEFDKGG